MAFEEITVQANGSEFEGWETVRVTAGIAQESVEFEIGTTETIEAGKSPFDVWHFPPFTAIKVLAGGSLLCGGLVDDYIPTASPESHSVTIRGRGQSSVLYDSSADHETGRFENMSVGAIIQALAAPFGVPVQIAATAAAAAAKVVPWYQIRRGETVWSEAMRLAEDYAVTLMGEFDGTLTIMRAGTGRHAGGIAQGNMPGTIKVKELSGILSGAGRYSEIRIPWQSSVGAEDDDDVFEGEATAEDSGVPFFKMREIIPGTEMDAERAQSLASWSASRAAGFATKATIVVAGFRDIAGHLWQPGFYVFVFSPFLKIEADMLITEVIFEQSNDAGTITTITVLFRSLTVPLDRSLQRSV